MMIIIINIIMMRFFSFIVVYWSAFQIKGAVWVMVVKGKEHLTKRKSASGESKEDDSIECGYVVLRSASCFSCSLGSFFRVSTGKADQWPMWHNDPGCSVLKNQMVFPKSFKSLVFPHIFYHKDLSLKEMTRWSWFSWPTSDLSVSPIFPSFDDWKNLFK